MTRKDTLTGAYRLIISRHFLQAAVVSPMDDEVRIRFHIRNSRLANLDFIIDNFRKGAGLANLFLRTLSPPDATVPGADVSKYCTRLRRDMLRLKLPVQSSSVVSYWNKIAGFFGAGLQRLKLFSLLMIPMSQGASFHDGRRTISGQATSGHIPSGHSTTHPRVVLA